MNHRYPTLLGLALLLSSPLSAFEWQNGSPESQNISGEKLEELTENLAARNTKAFLVIRNDRIVHEWYAEGHSRTKKHFTASMAKALVGGVSTALAITDGKLDIHDRAADYIPQWKTDSKKSKITIAQLGSHTSGIQDAKIRDEGGGSVDQKDFPGWEGDFWRWRSDDHPTDRGAFVLSRDVAPVIFEPGKEVHYSNPG
ncbi:MAG: serine hydrolase, partial [Verrucomicrobiae bacterium]|nr:serine hydrolase [Verrucomicrobiae bacterium]